MDAKTLSEAMGGALPLARYQQLLPAFEASMRAANITTALRAAHFCSQLGHESAGLKYQNEIWGPTAAQRSYDGRMGNRPGTNDWSKFRGHGWIQITGADNHLGVSKWAHSKGIVPTATYFYDHPEALGNDQYAGIGPAWYWTVARPNLNAQADRDDLEAVTRSINGGLNGLADRRQRLQRCKQLGTRILPTPRKGDSVEKVLPYPRDQVTQDTIYNCGPASVQTIIRSKTGKLHTEATLGSQLGTHRGGTDYIGQFPTVLNRHLPGAGYRHQDMPNDPPTQAQIDKLWRDITGSINAGYGVVANIVAPPSNYPRAVAPSTISPAYGGGTVYHYFAIMGYAGAGASRRVWVADSGFYPYGYWLSLSQLATLIPPKGYAYATAKVTPKAEPKNKETQVDKAQADRIERLLTLILDQLVGPEKDKKGPKFTGWQQLDGKTLVDAVADIRNIVNKEDK